MADSRASGSHERILIAGGRVYDHDADVNFPPVMDIVVEGGRIADVTLALDIDPAARAHQFDRVIDVRRKLVLPGFINSHYHSHDTLLKGSFETIPLDLWGSYAMPSAFPRRSRQELRIRTIVGAIECLRSGITTVQDMATLTPFDEDDVDIILDAYAEVGIRCIFAPQFTNVPRVDTRVFYKDLIPAGELWRLSSGVRQFAADSDIVELLGRAIRTRRGRHSLIDFALGPSSPETCSRDIWEALTRLSKDENIPIYTHIYENKGMTHIARERFGDHRGSLIHWLKDIGALGPHVTFAHSVWLRGDEMDLLAQTGANVVLNPVGNLKTRSGVAPARALLDRGINVALGCDNCSCSDAQNMFQSMKLFTLLAAICSPDEGPPIASDALRAATLGGAAAAGRADIGAIKSGMSADLSVIDLTDISFVPLNSVARQLVYTESGRAVETVLVGGRVVIDNRKVVTIDEAALAAEVDALMPTVRGDLDAVRKRLDPILNCLCEAQSRTWQSNIGVSRFISQEC